VKKLKFISNNHFEVIGEKIEVADVKEVKSKDETLSYFWDELTKLKKELQEK
jgi:hypothetical protein